MIDNTKIGPASAVYSIFAISQDTAVSVVVAMVGALLMFLNLHSDSRKNALKDEKEHKLGWMDMILGVLTGGFIGVVLASLAHPISVIWHIPVGDVDVDNYKVYIAGVGGFFSPNILGWVKSRGKR